jgi:hypothetical protein
MVSTSRFAGRRAASSPVNGYEVGLHIGAAGRSAEPSSTLPWAVEQSSTSFSKSTCLKALW